MTVYKEFRIGGGGGSPFGFFGPLIGLALFFTILFFLAKGLFWALSWVSPILLIAALILDYTVVTDYLKFILTMLKENTLMGVLAVIVTFFGYPFVAGYLLLKAIGKRQINKFTDNVKKEQTTFADYEEVQDDDEQFLELPPIQKKQGSPLSNYRGQNDYDDMFK